MPYAESVQKKSSLDPDLELPKRRSAAFTVTSAAEQDVDLAATLVSLKKQNENVQTAAQKLNSQLDRLERDSDENSPEWLQNAKHLTSLLKAYDARISELESSLGVQQHELEHVKSKYTVAVQENTILRDRLSSISSSRQNDSFLDSEELRNAQDQIEYLTKENEILLDQQKSAAREVENLRAELVKRVKELSGISHNAENYNTHIKELEDALNRSKGFAAGLEKDLRKYINEVDALTSENETLRAMDRTKTNQLSTYETKCSELKRSLDEITDKFSEYMRETAVMATREKDLVTSLRATEDQLEEFKVKYTIAMKEITQLRTENEEVTKRSKALEERVLELQEKEVKHFKNLQKHIELAEDAKIEHEKAQTREELALKEVERLRTRLQEVIARQTSVREQERTQLQAEFAEERKKLTLDVNELETKCAELRSATDRAMREKRSAEAELQTAKKTVPLECERLNGIIDELNLKLRSSEKQRVTLSHSLESLNARLVREQNRIETDKQQYAAQLEEVHRRLRRAEQELEASKEEQIRVMKKFNDTEYQRQTAQQKLEEFQSQYQTELAAVQHRYAVQVDELKNSLETVNQAHSKTCREMQNLLGDQKRTAERWQAESQSITERYESLLSDLRMQLQALTMKMDDLQAQLAKANAYKQELLTQLSEEKKSQARLNVVLQNAEIRADNAMRQVQSLLGRESEVLGEKKRLLKEIDRLKIEKERLQRGIHKPTISEQTKAQPESFTMPEKLNLDTDKDVQALHMALERIKLRSQSRQTFQPAPVALEDEDSDLVLAQ